jgi:hypothetical protein
VSNIKILFRQDGIAMPTVIILFVIIMIFTASALTVAMNQTKMNEKYIGSVDALHFAEAGLNEYLWHLNKVESGSIALNEDINIGDGIYRIEYIEGSVNDGYIKLRSSGFHVAYPDSVRTIEVIVSKRSFTQYVWLSNLDVRPGAAPNSNNGIYSPFDCIWNAGPLMHEWYGPYHTNGTLNIWGSPKFHDRVTYSTQHPDSGNQWGIRTAPSNWTDYPQPAVLNNTTFIAGMPELVSEVPFPQNNSELMARAQQGGHYYNGITAIYLKGDTYDVRTYDRDTSQWKYNGVAYTFGSSADQKPSTASLTLPANGIIFVNGLDNGLQWRRRTGDLYISGELNGHLTIAAARNIYITGYDPTDWREPTSGTNPARLPRGLHTGGLTYTSNTDSLLGLIANNNIEILHNNWLKHGSNNNTSNQRWWNNNHDVAPYHISLYGAYMAINGTVTYEGRGSYNKGVATVVGSMIQNRRSAFAQGINGYGRSYTHDPRLLYQTPPYFIEPSESGWEINEWREVSTHVEVAEN